MSRMGGLPASVYPGGAYADNCMVITSDRDSESDLGALWELVRTGEVAQRIRAVDQSLNITPGSALAAKVQLASDHAPLPKPSSDEPTQWLFRGLVAGSRNPMQVAVARLLGFQWPDQEPDDVDGLADEDGIVCLPALGGEVTAEERLRTLMAKVYGTQWTHQLLESLLIDAGAKPGVGLEKWLRAAFFKDHCRVFSNRPFIWQVWDGRPDGFSALVNYHKLDRRLLESLTYNYLGNWWIGRQRDEVAGGAIGAEARLTAALELKQKLELILLGEPPYDIYVRWKSLEEQPMGWDPDLDDGVRLNIRPFMMASVLRAKPNIHWKKDRGKNPDGSDRHNDVHLTLAEKREARQAASRGRS